MQPKFGFFRRLWRTLYPLLIWFGATVVAEMAFLIFGAAQFIFDPAILNSMDYSQLIDYAFDHAERFLLENSLLLTCIADAIAAAVLFLFFRLDAKNTEKYNRLTTLTVKSPASYVSCISIACAACILFEIVLSFLMAIVTSLGGSTGAFDEVSDTIVNSSMLMQVITVVIVGPICEELLMRALVFKRMRTCHGFWFSAIMSSVIFGLIHGNWVQFIYATFVGFLLAYVYEMTGNITVPILFHIVANGLSTLMSTDALSPYFTNLLYGDTIVVTLVLCSTAIPTGMIAMYKVRNLKISENY